MAVNPLGDPTDNEALDIAVQWHIKKQRHMFPARIVEFDLETQTATVESTVKFAAVNVATGEIVDEAVIRCPGIPIAFYGTGDWSMTGPIHIGDEGLCHVSDVCLSEWKATTATPATPKNLRRWNQNDAIWEPKHCRPSKPLPTNENSFRGAVDISNNEQVCIRVAEGQGISLGSLAVTSLIALADLVLARLNQIKTAYELHTHVLTLTAGTGTAAPTTSTIGTINSVASARVGSE